MTRLIKPDFSPESFHERALFCIDNQNYVDAIGFLNAAIKRNADETEYYLDLADCYRALGCVEGALKNYCRALSMDKYAEDAYVGLMQTFVEIDRPEMALFYLSMGLDVGALGEEYEPDEDFLKAELGEDIRFAASAMKENKFKLLDKYDCEDKLNFAKKLLMSGQSELARQVAEDIPKESKQYYEAQKLLASLFYAFGDKKEALLVCDRILLSKPSDPFALSIKMSAHHSLGEVEEAEKTAKVLDGLNITTKDDLFRLAISFAEAEDDLRAAACYKRLNDEYPYSIEIMLPCALAHYNCGKKATASSLVKKMRKLFPDDTVVAYYARHILGGKIDRFPVFSDLPEGERLRRLHRIEEAFSMLQHIEAVALRLDSDDELNEMVRWVLTCPQSKISAHVADFLTQDKVWGRFIADLLLDPKVPASTKKDYLISYLKNGEPKSFSMLVGDIFQSFKVHIPKCADTPKMRECYYETYGMMAFLASDFSKKLNRAYKTVVEKMSAPDYESFAFENKIMSAVICYLTKAHPILTKKSNCCEIFECTESELQEYLYKLKIETKQGEENA